MRPVAKVAFVPSDSPACGLLAYADDSVPDDLDSKIGAIFLEIGSGRTVGVGSLEQYLAPRLAALGLVGQIDWDGWGKDSTAVRVTLRASVSQK